MILTGKARAKAGEYGITESEIAEVIAAPDGTERGRGTSVILHRKVGQRTIYVITDHTRETVVTTYVPDDEWFEMHPPERHLTVHAQDRMEDAGLVPADLDYIIENATKRDRDDKGNVRSHLVYLGRYIVVVTDQMRREVITVTCKDSFGAVVRGRVQPTMKAYEETIADLRRQLQHSMQTASAERERAECAERKLSALIAWLEHPPVSNHQSAA